MRLTTLAFGALCLSVVPTLAADLPNKLRPVLKAPPPAAFSWAGCYAGGFAGYAAGSNVNVTEPTSSGGGAFPAGDPYHAPYGAPFSYGLSDSITGGGTIGCNWQPSSQVVLGLEGEFGYMRMTGSVINPNSVPTLGSDTTSSAHVGDWYGVLAGRLGYAVDRTLLYVKGGAAFTQISASMNDNCTVAPCGTGTLNATGSGPTLGWTVGGGIEYAMGTNWSLKAEYLYLNFDQSFDVCGAGGGGAAGARFCGAQSISGIHTGKIGLNYKLF